MDRLWNLNTGIWLASGRFGIRNDHTSSLPQDPVVSHIFFFFPIISASWCFSFLLQKHEPTWPPQPCLAAWHFYKVSHPTSQGKELDRFISRSVGLWICNSYPQCAGAGLGDNSPGGDMKQVKNRPFFWPGGPTWTDTIIFHRIVL